jgi:hypothetical protein
MSAAPQRRMSRIKWGLAGAALIAIGCRLALSPLGIAEIEHRGRTFRVPVPYATIRIASREDQATYWALGYPDLHQELARRGAAMGWADDGQFGAIYRIASTSNENLRIAAIFELKTRFFTEITFHVEEY